MIPLTNNQTLLCQYMHKKLQIPHTSSFHILQLNEKAFKHPTYRLNFSGEELVLHKIPSQPRADSQAFYREYTLMSTLGKLGFPVPETLLYCFDTSIIGTEFYITKFLRGRVFRDPSLPGIPPAERREIYMEMVRVLALLHSYDPKKLDLEACVEKSSENYLEQIDSLSQNYKAAKTGHISSMENLMQWLPKNVPSNEGLAAICHGDYRLENIVFHETEPKILAVLNWKSCSIGHPYADLAHNCTAYRIPRNKSGLLLSIGRFDKGMYGIPLEKKLVQEYCRKAGVNFETLMGPNENYWRFYLSFSLFRSATLYQETYKASLNERNADNYYSGKFAMAMANIAWKIAHSNEEVVEKSLIDNIFGFSENYYNAKRKLLDFMEEYIYPNERVYFSQVSQEPSLKWKIVPPIMEELKLKAKEVGLWNMGISSEGPKLNFLEFASLFETVGSSLIAPEVFNCSPPDGGNISALIMFGNNEQKERYLRPLMEGEIRSGIAMTEPGIASSDATNIETTVIKDPLNPDYYLVNGRKWWVNGGGDPRFKVIFLVGRTPNPKKRPHEQHSMILVPVDAEGVKKVRPLTSFGYDEAPGGFWEYLFTNVRVHKSNLFGEEGKGFEIAQIRMGPGKIIHCMKAVGQAQRCFEAMCMRVTNRKAFGKLLMDQGIVLSNIASSKIDLHQMRLMGLYAAKCVVTKGAKNSREEIAAFKVAAPKMALRVIERAIHVHGAGGLSDDFMLSTALKYTKNLRFADGPDEVHETTLATMELESYIDSKL